MVNKIFISVLLTFTFIGCNSTKGRKDLGGGLFSSVDDDLVIQRSGQKRPIISPFSNQKWKEVMSEKGSSEFEKMYAMLTTGASFEAERASRSYLAKNPGNPVAIVILASSLALGRQYDLASYYANLVATIPQHKSDALNIVGLAKLANAKKITDYQEAESILRNSFNASTKAIAAGLNLGHMYLELGDAKEAMSIFQSTSVRCSKCTNAVIGYGVSAARLNKFKEAETAFLDIVKKNKHNLPAQFYLALLYKNSNKNKLKTEKTLQKIIDDETPGYSDLKSRAQVVLRQLKGEASEEDPYSNDDLGGDSKTETILFGKS